MGADIVISSYPRWRYFTTNVREPILLNFQALVLHSFVEGSRIVGLMQKDLLMVEVVVVPDPVAFGAQIEFVIQLVAQCGD